jgi:hypothetical protein
LEGVMSKARIFKFLKNRKEVPKEVPKNGITSAKK